MRLVRVSNPTGLLDWVVLFCEMSFSLIKAVSSSVSGSTSSDMKIDTSSELSRLSRASCMFWMSVKRSVIGIVMILCSESGTELLEVVGRDDIG